MNRLQKLLCVVLSISIVLCYPSMSLASELTEQEEYLQAFEETVEKINSGDYSAVYIDEDGAEVLEYSVTLPSGREIISEIRTRVIKPNLNETMATDIMPREVTNWVYGARMVHVGESMAWSFTWDREAQGYILGGSITASAVIYKETTSKLVGGNASVSYIPPGLYTKQDLGTEFTNNGTNSVSFVAWVQFTSFKLLTVKYHIEAEFSCDPNSPTTISYQHRFRDSL